ncbi:MAG: hypothetical protein WBA13_02340 [Microcoleaceae cyanobacterium]
MLNTLRFTSHLLTIVVLLLGAGFLSTVSFANSLRKDDNPQFRTHYLESCLSGMTQLAIPSLQAERYCSCTADQILSLRDQKLQTFTTMTLQDLQADPDLRQVIMACWQPLMELDPES